ncbi:MAG TPA: maleylacetoacetate isomerase [Hyphomicrobiaceae bacterium]|nr:maleylacetoacetate isomerase [Hyphomicrobiaceae bacterium]
MKLHGYFRSSAAYRVRIALNLKGLAVEQVSYHLRNGEQRSPAYLAMNPQGLVPSLELDDGRVLTQSLAIIEWLEEAYPEPPLLPKESLARARVRALALVIAADTHPLQNLKVLLRLKRAGLDAEAWAREVNLEGLEAANALIEREPGPFCFGASPTLADICLVPQMANARRFSADISKLERILQAEAACNRLAAFQDAAPDRQPDAETG